MDLTQVIIALLGLFSAVLTGLLVPYLKNKSTAESWLFTAAIVTAAVQAAEQLLKNKTGEEKKLYVLEYLESKNIKLSEKDLDMLIEAAVLEMNKVKAKLGGI